MSKFSVILVLMFSYPFIFVHDADSRAERVEFPTSCLSFIRLFFMRLSVASVVFVSGASKR